MFLTPWTMVVFGNLLLKWTGEHSPVKANSHKRPFCVSQFGICLCLVSRPVYVTDRCQSTFRHIEWNCLDNAETWRSQQLTLFKCWLTRISEINLVRLFESLSFEARTRPKMYCFRNQPLTRSHSVLPHISVRAACRHYHKLGNSGCHEGPTLLKTSNSPVFTQ